MENITYDIPFASIVEAYEECCKNKRSSPDRIRFSANFPSELVRIWNEIRQGVYKPKTSLCFVVQWPVYREVFAANFADRVVHHWWALRVNPLYEACFIEQGNVSKNCRKGEGVLSAVLAAQQLMNEHKDWWVGKFDLEGFFMSLDKALAWEMMEIFLTEEYKGDDLECLLYVTRTIIFHCPQDDCRRRSPIEYWDHIPPRKTLFGQPKGKGCAIGNLPSQLMANFYMSVFDYWLMKWEGYDKYIRFVDDFIILAPTKKELTDLLPKIRQFLSEQLLIKLHPKKIYIQPVSRGMLYVGAYIRPGRIYISNRTRGKMIDCLRKYNKLAEEGKAEENIEHFVSSMNSYLGMMVHFNSFKVRRTILPLIHKEWWKYIMLDGKFRKLIIKNKYKPLRQMREQVRKGNYAALLTPDLVVPEDSAEGKEKGCSNAN